MKQSTFIASDEMDLVKEDCVREIVTFGEQFQLLQKIYRSMGLYYPEECITNFRDAWFHYRKLYKKKDTISIYNEKYGLEEHLLRAAKDAQIGFLQQLGYWLEIWYRYDEYMTCDMSRTQDYERLFHDADKNWVLSTEIASQEDNNLFANACLYYFIKYINSNDLRQKLQALVHSIKNLILDIRLGGVNIFRPSNNIYYLEQFVSVYNNMCKSLQTKGMLYLISSTGVILEECRR